MSAREVRSSAEASGGEAARQTEVLRDAAAPSLYCESVAHSAQPRSLRHARERTPLAPQSALGAPLALARDADAHKTQTQVVETSSASQRVRALLEFFGAVQRSVVTVPALRTTSAVSFESSLELSKFAQRHYARGAARNALQIAGSLRALGNPLGLARGVLRGLEDAVREPVQGLMEGIDDAKPEAFALGLQRGASSLVRCTVGGTADSLAQVQGAACTHTTRCLTKVRGA